MIGEGQYVAITNRMFFRQSQRELISTRMDNMQLFESSGNSVREFYRSRVALGLGDEGRFDGMHPDELWLHYSKSYLEMDSLLEAHPDLAAYLWNLAQEGVSDADFQPVLDRLPGGFRELVLDGEIL